MDEFLEYTVEEESAQTRLGKYFTPDEANRALVLVRRIVEDMITQYARLGDMQEALDRAKASGSDERYEAVREDLLSTANRLHGFLEELEEVGVEIKDWARGIVDFPCLLDGQEVCLCWAFDEPHVAYWHEPEAGYAGRQPIETLAVSRAIVADA